MINILSESYVISNSFVTAEINTESNSAVYIFIYKEDSLFKIEKSLFATKTHRIKIVLPNGKYHFTSIAIKPTTKDSIEWLHWGQSDFNFSDFNTEILSDFN